MIVFRDFAQKILELPGWFSSGRIEAVEETMVRMNHWIEEVNPNIINIETIQAILRNDTFTIKPMGKVSSANGSFSVYHGTIFRVWYKQSSK